MRGKPTGQPVSKNQKPQECFKQDVPHPLQRPLRDFDFRYILSPFVGSNGFWNGFLITNRAQARRAKLPLVGDWCVMRIGDFHYLLASSSSTIIYTFRLRLSDLPTAKGLRKI
eukprot:477759-Amorphochlora_amoeboformis.AAC.1